MTTRKDFLATVAAAAATPAAASQPRAKVVASKAGLTFTFDRAKFDEMLGKPATHKQCFGITKIDDGAGLQGMMNSIMAYDDFLNEGPGAMHAAAVLYHGASIGFAMSDAVWNSYLIPLLPHAPARIRQDIGTLRPGTGNPYKAQFHGLVARGASFFVCHNAIAGFSDLVASALKTSAQKVHDAILAGILPGALVVPAGVMAINACQEAKFTYIDA